MINSVSCRERLRCPITPRFSKSSGGSQVGSTRIVGGTEGGNLNDLFFARSQMGMSLAFHIVFAVIGMAMPLLMVVSEGC
jgi:hypothetical protein